MPKPDASLPEDYFNDVYRNSDDPWNFETSEYERDKYQATVNALPKPAYTRAFEIGCSIGVLSELLAGRCQNLLSIDIADAPLAKARVRLRNHPQATFQKMTVPDEFPAQNFDLIVMSEVGYYMNMPDLLRLQQKIVAHLNSCGQLLLVHWTPVVPDYPLTGDEVHETFLKICGPGGPLTRIHGQREKNYRLDLLEKKAGR